MRLPEKLRLLADRLAGREPSIEDERLFELFRNRVALKKELTALDDDRHRLLDRLKLQEGATMRVEEQVASLEQYLGQPDEGYKSLAYFQLRALWRVACKRLEQFGAELARQQKDRERKTQLAEFDRARRERVARVDRELVEARVLGRQLQAEQTLAISGNVHPDRLALVLEKVADLPYGEIPHQRAAFYRETTHRSGSLADASQLHGAPPTFNNLLDIDAAYRIASDYTTPTVVIAKHTDPVGIATSDELVEAYRKALETDPVASFGGIVGVNRELDGATAREIAANSYEAVVAPGFSQAALGILQSQPGLELLAVPPSPTEGMRDYGIADLDFKRVGGGLLVVALDSVDLDRGRLQVVTKRHPTLGELTDLLFAWRAVRHVRSNAIVLVRNAAKLSKFSKN